MTQRAALSIVVNGKFLRAEQTGVHRVACELANALADLKREKHPAVAALAFEVWHTRDGATRAANIRLPRREIPFLTGIPWEQLTMTVAPGRRMLLSLCNIGPVLRANAVTMIHDVQVHLSPESYRRPFRLWYRFVQPILGYRNRHILTVSEFSREKIAEVGLAPRKRISVIHNGADHILRERADTSVIAQLALEKQCYVVALASVQAHKNIGVLLRAFSHPQLSGARLVLIGGAGRADFEAMGIPVPKGVVFAGRVSDGALRALMEGALCIAFPSLTEGFGLPPLEAMLLGCPALVAPCGAMPEVCGDAALYVEPDDPRRWAEAIMSLIQSPERREQLAKAGQERAALFTWRSAAVKLATVLTDLIQKG